MARPETAMPSRLHLVWLSPALLLAGLSFSAAPPTQGPPPPARQVDFVRDVQPLLSAYCLNCHGPKKQKGGLRLDSRAAALRDGTIVPGHGATSPLFRRVAVLGPQKRMPPSGPG